jgi:hypothetical protein
MKWGADYGKPAPMRPSWKSKRDTPWVGIFGMAIIVLMGIAMIYIGDKAGGIGGWLDRIMEALS